MRILLQTTIPSTPDDWSIERFSKLHRTLAESGHEVTSRNKDESLRAIDRSRFEQIWLFGVDAGRGIGEAECAALTRFRKSGTYVTLRCSHTDRA